MYIFSHDCLATSCLKQVIFSWFVILMCNSFFVHFLSSFGLDIENTGRWSLMSFMSKPLQVSQFDWYVNILSINVALDVVIRLGLYIDWYKPNLSSWSIKSFVLIYEIDVKITTHENIFMVFTISKTIPMCQYKYLYSIQVFYSNCY